MLLFSGTTVAACLDIQKLRSMRLEIHGCPEGNREIRAFWPPLESENSSSNFELWAIS